MKNGILLAIWRLIQGPLQWWALWLAHAKFIVGVNGIVLNADGQILLLRHRYWKEGSWGLPGGYANRGEKLEDTLAREVREETGYIIQVRSLIRVVSGYKLRLEASYLAEIIGGDCVIEPGEIIEAKYFSVDDLPDGLLNTQRELIGMALPSLKEPARWL